MANKEKVNVVERDGVFIVFNNSQTIFASADSIEKAFTDYKEKINTSQRDAIKYGLNIEQSNNNSPRNGLFGAISSKKFIIALIIIALIVGNIFSSLNQIISSAPEKIKNSFFYAESGVPRCYVCSLERIIDALNRSFDLQTEDDIKRIHLKLEKLTLNWKKISGSECIGK
jgi:hypothetical protein